MKQKQKTATAKLAAAIRRRIRVRLTTDTNRRASLDRAYRYSASSKDWCCVLTRGRGGNRRYLAHPMPWPDGWRLVAVVGA